MARKALFLLLLLCSCCFFYGQEGFMIKNDRRRTKIKFDLVNNLIVVPVKLNGVELSFLLDTGVNTSLLLDLSPQDSLELLNAEKIQLRGLGGHQLIDAYRSTDNVMEIGKVKNEALELYVIYDEDINFSPRLGVAVNGILGYDFFKDFVVEINYSRKFIRVHDPGRFTKKMRGYRELPLQFYRNKPYLLSEIDVDDRRQEVMLLLDNGLSDALWLFPQTMGLQVPEKSFKDLLGLGLLGDVTGDRGRIQSFQMGEIELNNVTASFPDSSSVRGLKMFTERNGSIGGELLRRFNIYMDYDAGRMFVKKNKNFRNPFNYNMSGIVLEHGGFVVVESYETVIKPVSSGSEGEEVFKAPVVYKKFSLQPSFRIVRLRENSPGSLVGLQVGDLLVKVNGKSAYHFSLEELTHLFSSEDGKSIKLEIEREGMTKEFEFRLKKLL
ncbi:MAG: aspartyl protease family protein [Salinimicrobium sp.]